MGMLRGDQCCVSGSRIRCLFNLRIRDPGWIKNQDSDPGSWMNNPDHISERLETIFVWVILIILKFYDADLGSWLEKNSDSSTPWVCSYLRIIQKYIIVTRLKRCYFINRTRPLVDAVSLRQVRQIHKVHNVEFHLASYRYWTVPGWVVDYIWIKDDGSQNILSQNAARENVPYNPAVGISVGGAGDITGLKLTVGKN